MVFPYNIFQITDEKIIIIKGGLGNQFFQYSFSKYVESKFPNDKIYLDFSIIVIKKMMIFLNLEY